MEMRCLSAIITRLQFQQRISKALRRTAYITVMISQNFFRIITDSWDLTILGNLM
ncbi:hypothetical protein LINPERHAP2_LOCUS6777 [Linum perenne]